MLLNQLKIAAVFVLLAGWRPHGRPLLGHRAKARSRAFRRQRAPQRSPRPKRRPSDKKSVPQPIQVRGVVVDEAGRPVAGAVVRAGAFPIARLAASPVPTGRSRSRLRRQRVDGTDLLARSPADDAALGFFRYDYNLDQGGCRETGSDRLEAEPGGHRTRQRLEQGLRARGGGRGRRQLRGARRRDDRPATVPPGSIFRPTPRSSGSSHSSQAGGLITPNSARSMNQGRSKGGGHINGLSRSRSH